MANATTKILSLDGGGAKGFYTLGVLHEIEALLGGKPLCESFRVIYGTSTGSIIGSLLGLGHSVDKIYKLYCEHVPKIMSGFGKYAKTEALRTAAKAVFKGQTFSDFKTDVGIVTTHRDLERPLIFKTSSDQAYGRKESFVPGFGCKIADAVVASCSAYPFFERSLIKTPGSQYFDLIDGGYCANNPTLYAVAEATAALGIARSDLRVVSVGVGRYPEPHLPKFSKAWFINSLTSVRLLQMTLEVNTQSMEQLRAFLFKDVPTVRINDVFDQPDMATDIFEQDMTKLNLLMKRGRDSYGKHEAQLRKLLLD